MPSQSRIDTRGALHHIIARGIERRDIFEDDQDRCDFLKNPGLILEQTETACFAWSLMSNPFHLLLGTGAVPVATVMRRLLTGHAIRYNRCHRRRGHLFQNRYKSILCQKDRYLLELVGYIHLNPLRAKLVAEVTRTSWETMISSLKSCPVLGILRATLCAESRRDRYGFRCTTSCDSIEYSC